MKKICVIGSLNIDMAAKTPHLPQIGETVLMDGFELFIGGGKGANQAVAAGKLGADVRMVGLLGDQFYGEMYLDVLKHNGVKHDTVHVLKGEYPGVAYVAVDDRGRNMIFVYSGANMKVSPKFIDENWPVISQCDIFLLQQETPMEANLHVMRRLSQLEDKVIILDPAPAVGFTPEYLKYADIITPNEAEMAAISGMSLESEARAACERLREMGAGTVVFKAGVNGAYLCDNKGFCHSPSFTVDAVDTTAAGDSFNAGLAFGLALELDLSLSIRLGHAVAAISTTKLGAQSAMPDMDTLLAFLDSNDIGFSQVIRERFDQKTHRRHDLPQ